MINSLLKNRIWNIPYQGPRRWLRFHEKGGKEHENMKCLPTIRSRELSTSTSLRLVSRVVSPCSRASIMQAPRYPAAR
jgi:hypothetical protein